MKYHHHRKKSIDDVLKTSPIESVKKRLPWLFIGLVGGIIASQIINSFELVLRKNIFLAGFIPLIVYMSDAVGTQMEAFAIRDLALHERLKLKKYFLKQLLITFIIALSISACLYFYAFYSQNNIYIATTLASSIFLAIISSIFTGILIPFLILKKLKLDPANASGPVATIIQDLISVTIYFILASTLL